MSIDILTRPIPSHMQLKFIKKIHTDVLVIGGGATGTGVARDLAMRGFRTVLVEKRDFSHGTTGRFHGLLHSGGRYVVKDPQAAKECIEENHILRKIMPHCIEDTGGFFVVTPWDDPSYTQRFVEGCHQAGIPVEEVSHSQMLKTEPLLNPKITHCFRVPDGGADAFLAAECNVRSARDQGASILNYHEVIQLILERRNVVGARCQDLVKDEEIRIFADLVVIAAGAWSGKIAATAKVPIKILPGKGTMIAVDHRVVNTVINRCKMPSDGDILVPAHTVAVIGTTDIPVDDPERFAIDPWEVNLLLEEGEKIIPGFKNMRMMRAWAGVRPLYQESGASQNRDITRAFVLLDHEERDGMAGLITITSGKWTTYRKMAEVTTDLVCKKLGVQRPCRTHLEELPGNGKHGYHTLGDRLARIEKNKDFGKLVCECELATLEDVTASITSGEAKTLDDIRRDARLGKGPCQGGFCTMRAAGLLHKIRRPTVEETNVALRDFLQERWKGLLSIMWGQQLRQERLDELIYLSLLNADHLPGPESSRLKPELYEEPHKIKPKTTETVISSELFPPHAEISADLISPTYDTIVVGAGLSGLTSAWQAAQKGKRVAVICKGWGTLHWHAGCVDVYGYDPVNYAKPVDIPSEALARLIERNPSHPYALTGLEGIDEALKAFQGLCQEYGYLMQGSIERNWLLPTSLGTIRPTCLAPETMVKGDVRRKEPILVVGFEGYLDFYPELIAANLNAQRVPARAATLKLESLAKRSFITGRVLAELLDTMEFRKELIETLKSQVKRDTWQKGARIGFPAVLGLKQPIEILGEFEDQLGIPIFEIPTLPPSIPGIRLHNLLVKAIEEKGGRVIQGMQVVAAETRDGMVSTLFSEAAARLKPHRASKFILATGGILGGGIHVDYATPPQEVILNLPVEAPSDRQSWFEQSFISSKGHSLFRCGIAVNSQFQPIDLKGNLLYDNLRFIGAGLANCDPLQERSLEGVALATGYLAGRRS